ncbi:hypothetical protein F4859DRAFT_510070 [Xylaria cf. heliscus]|nr:hypothetical protein F4859DRAFT_510070 [Xylaria cf. heliscus]
MSTNGIYFLNAGSAESEGDRLNRQHHLFDDILHNELLPPHIASALATSPTPPKIVEIATGTGIWLLEVAKTLSPDAELVGLDYDTSKFPTASSLASNITLRQADMLKPFPSDLLGKFDVVNVRLIVFALKEGYGTDLVRNLMTLLKPGGYIVWAETSPVSTPHLTSFEPPSKAWFKFQDINWRFAKKVGRDMNLPIGMQYYIKEAGCVECDEKAYASSAQLYTDKKKDWNQRMNLQFRTLIAQTCTGIVNIGGVEGMATEEDAAELIAQSQNDFVDYKIHQLFMRAWGRKPETSEE